MDRPGPVVGPRGVCRPRACGRCCVVCRPGGLRPPVRTRHLGRPPDDLDAGVGVRGPEGADLLLHGRELHREPLLQRGRVAPGRDQPTPGAARRGTVPGRVHGRVGRAGRSARHRLRPGRDDGVRGGHLRLADPHVLGRGLRRPRGCGGDALDLQRRVDDRVGLLPDPREHLRQGPFELGGPRGLRDLGEQPPGPVADAVLAAGQPVHVPQRGPVRAVQCRQYLARAAHGGVEVPLPGGRGEGGQFPHQGGGVAAVPGEPGQQPGRLPQEHGTGGARPVEPEQRGVPVQRGPHPGDVLLPRLGAGAEVLGEPVDVARVQGGLGGHPEQPCRPVPGRRVLLVAGQRLRPQRPAGPDLLERGRLPLRAAAQHPGAVVEQGVGGDEEVAGEPVESGVAEILGDPAPDVLDVEVAALLVPGRGLVDAGAPVAAHHQRPVVDGAEFQRFHDPLDGLQVVAVDVVGTPALVHRTGDPLQRGPQLARGHRVALPGAVGPEVRVLGVQRGEHAVGEVQRVGLEALAALLPRLRELRLERQHVAPVRHLGPGVGVGRPGQPVHLGQCPGELVGEGVAGHLQLPPHLGPVVGREGAGVVGEPVPLQQEGDPHQPAELGAALVGEEVGEPHQRRRGDAGLPQFLDAVVVVAGVVVAVVEGVVDDEPHVARGRRGELLVGQVGPVAHVAEDELGDAPGAPPDDLLLGDELPVADADRLPQPVPQPHPPHTRLVLLGDGVEQRLDVEVGQVQREHRVGLAVGADLGRERGLEVPHPPHDDVPGGHGPRAHRAVVEGGEARARQPPQGGHVGCERAEQHRLHEPLVGPEVGVRVRAVLLQQVGACLRGELHRRLRLALQLVGEGGSRARAVHEDVPQVAQRDEPADGGVGVPLQQLLHQLQAGPLPLERPGQCDQHVQQGRGERVHGPEVRPAGLGGSAAVEQDVLDLLPGPVDLRELGLEDRVLAGQRLQHPLLDDLRQVAVLQVDRVEPLVEVFEGLLHRLDVGAEHVGADELGQVALTGDERHDRHRPVRVAGLDQFHQLLDLAVDEGPVPHVRLEPQHQLVEEQHHAVVLQRAGVPADRRQPVLQRHVLGRVAARALRVRPHRPGEQRGLQPLPARVPGGRGERLVQLGRGPGAARADDLELVVVLVHPAVTGVGGQQPHEGVVAELLPHPPGVGQHGVGAEHGRRRRVRVLLPHGPHVPAEQRLVEVGRAHQVVRHHEEAPPAQPLVVLGDDLPKARLGARGGLAVEHGVQHGQEVGLTGTERSVQVGGVRGVLADGAADQFQRLVELLPELRRDHVLLDPPGGPAAEPLGQLDLEVAGVDVLLDVEYVPQYDRPARAPGHRLLPLPMVPVCPSYDPFILPGRGRRLEGSAGSGPERAGRAAAATVRRAPRRPPTPSCRGRRGAGRSPTPRPGRRRGEAPARRPPRCLRPVPRAAARPARR